MKKTELRECEFDNRRVLFHGFFQKNDGEMAEAVAIIEYSNGEVGEVPAYRISFKD